MVHSVTRVFGNLAVDQTALTVEVKQDRVYKGSKTTRPIWAFSNFRETVWHGNSFNDHQLASMESCVLIKFASRSSADIQRALTC